MPQGSIKTGGWGDASVWRGSAVKCKRKAKERDENIRFETMTLANMLIGSMLEQILWLNYLAIVFI